MAQEIRAFVNALDEDQQIDLVALTWVGRGDYDIGEWAEARNQAAAAHNDRTADYLLGLPLLSEFLEDALVGLRPELRGRGAGKTLITFAFSLCIVGQHDTVCRSRRGSPDIFPCSERQQPQQGTSHMHAVIRTYSGKGATELFALLAKNKAEIEKEFRGINGFLSYAMIKTEDGGVTVTVGKTKGAINKSGTLARNWLAKNAAGLKFKPAKSVEGKALIHAV